MKYFLIVLGIWFLISVVSVIMALSKQKRMNNYKELYKGMSLKEVIKLLGKDYKKTNESKFDTYTWSITSSKYNGIKNIVVKIKDDKVVDFHSIRPTIE